jgi:hypothetical protein
MSSVDVFYGTEEIDGGISMSVTHCKAFGLGAQGRVS